MCRLHQAKVHNDWQRFIQCRFRPANVWEDWYIDYLEVHFASLNGCEMLLDVWQV